jgi:hypothetical protein
MPIRFSGYLRASASGFVEAKHNKLFVEDVMATPWEQAENFVESKVNWFKSQTKNAIATRPLGVLEKIAGGWTGPVLDILDVPAWVFIYSPSSANQLFEWAGNIGPTDLARGVMGLTKLQTVKTKGGIVFLGAMIERQLRIPSVIVVRRSGLFIFDKPDDQYRLLTEEQWDEYARG